MKAKINNKYLGGKTGTTFKNIPEAKRAVEIEVVKMITSAYKKVVKK